MIKDVYKTDVWALARYVNQQRGSEVIPEAIISRAPSAELREGQKDEDSLPSYDQLDGVLKTYVDERKTLDQIKNGDVDDVQIRKRVLRLVRRNEYKRRQSPLGPKLSEIAFGRDWRYPITSK